MKNKITPLVLLVLSSMTYAQEPIKLTSRVVDNISKETYRYDEQNRLDSTYFEESEFKKYALYTYDEKGNLIKEDSYQLRGEEWVNTYYVEFTYNDNGQLLTRENFNSLGTQEFTQSTRQEWVYDENNRLDKVRTLIPSFSEEGKFDFYAEKRYRYDNDNLLTSTETHMTHFMTMDPNDLWLSDKAEYTYDEQGRQIKYLQTTFDEFNEGAVLATSLMTYTYDENGNMTEYTSYGGTDNTKVVARYVYHYDLKYKNEDLCLPLYFEKASMPHIISMSNSVNMITSEEWWQMPTGREELVHVGDYIYTYEGATGIGTAAMLQQTETNFYINAGKLFFTNVKPGAKVRVFAANGTEVLSETYKPGGIALQNLPAGIYLTRIDGTRDAFKFVK